MRFKRIFLIVCDSLGIGNAHDARQYHNVGANTLLHIVEQCHGLHVPTLQNLGLGQFGQYQNIPAHHNHHSYQFRLNEISNGKDTMTGHWEMMGLKTIKPFVTFTDTGFPLGFIELFEKKTGRKCVGNIACSGTKVLDMYGEHQIRTGDWIVYTSADSVFQIAANEAIIPLEELYKACEIAREIAMKDEWKVGRIIARPYIGNKVGEFKRTSHRHDYALAPFDQTLLNTLQDHHYDTIAIGKINDIFVGQGINEAIHSDNNIDGINKTIQVAKEKQLTGLVFVNLVDFDANYGHRRDPIGYGKCIEDFDKKLNELLKYLNNDDLLMITADHGNDPTYSGTDHTREQVPLIVYNPRFQNIDLDLKECECFGTIGATIAQNFSLKYQGVGQSIYNLLK